MTPTTITDEAAQRFARDTADHTLTVLHDDGLYRHLRFRAPDNGFYWFDLVTWPGYLSFTGDMDGYLFTRDTDMFAFFRMARGGINPGYWAEKIVDGRERTKTYSEDRFRQLVAEHVDDHLEGRDDDYAANLRKAVQEDILDGTDEHEEGARLSLDTFEFVYPPEPPSLRAARFQFEGTWEWDLRDWDWSFLWACHAIAWGIRQYDTSKAQPAGVGQ